MKLSELKKHLFSLNKRINSILNEINYQAYYDLQHVEYDETDMDEYMLYDTFCSLLAHLNYINHILNYLQQPVIEEGTIQIDEHENYTLNGIPVAKNDCIEILRIDEDKSYWELIISDKQENLDGQNGRIRKRIEE